MSVKMKQDLRPKAAGEQQRRTRPGPKRKLSTIQIGKAAIRIADTAGLEAVTMQRLGQELGITTMALYRYFRGKRDLLAVMIETAGGPGPDFAGVSRAWEHRLREWSRRCLEIYVRHPWFLEATTRRQTGMGPNELGWMDTALAILAEAGLSPGECYYAFMAILGHVRGYATFEGIKNRSASSRQWIQELKRVASHPTTYPTLKTVVESGALSRDRASAFDFGLTCIVDGIARSLRLRGSRPLRLTS
jgi:AcrR family transcriptional regulator